jgi:hypothetical protein
VRNIWHIYKAPGNWKGVVDQVATL